MIPARLASTRLPRKVLLPIGGKPMLAWVVEAAKACAQLERVIIATDSEEVMALGREQGWEMQLTSPDLASGSDRVQAVSQLVDADIYVNVQGDEPMLRPEHIDALLRPFNQPHGAAVDVTTLSTVCARRKTSQTRMPLKSSAALMAARCISRDRPFLMTGMGRASPHIASTLASMPIAKPHCKNLPRWLPVRWNNLSDWSNCDCWKTA